MFWEILLAILLGVIAGVITGLIPGIHINLISAIIIGIAGTLTGLLNPLSLTVLIIAMGVTHTFLDTIPSVFLGAPSSETALGVLPGHRFLLRGLGSQAVKYTLIGSFGGLVMSLAMLPLAIFLIETYSPLIEKSIVPILILVIIYMIMRDRKKLWAVSVFLLSGTLGLLVLNMPSLKNPLFPLLSGLFGIATLLVSLNASEKIPEQREEPLTVPFLPTIKALLAGQFSGFLTAVLPGLGGSTAAVIGMQIARKIGDSGFLILMGSISTVNFTLSLATVYAVGKARNGSIVAVKELIGSFTLERIMIYGGAALLAGSIALVLGIFISRSAAKVLTKVPYTLLVKSVIGMIILLVFLMTEWIGLFVLCVSTCIGLIPALVKVTRTHTMGCLLLPVLLYFLL